MVKEVVQQVEDDRQVVKPSVGLVINAMAGPGD
jgi:hypothetical protein